MRDDDFERDLSERLRTYESHLADAAAPESASLTSRRGIGWPAVALVGTVVVAAAIMAVVVDRPDGTIGSRSAQPSPSESAPSIRATPSASETEPAVPSPAATAAPSTTGSPPAAGLDLAWEGDAAVIDEGTVFRITAESGRFFALGGTRDGAAVWASDDGVSWERSDLPFPASWEPAAHVFVYASSVVTVSDRLVVVGAVGALDLLNAVVWESTDGVNWQEVDTGSFKADAYSVLDVTNGPAGLVVVTHHYAEGTGSAWRSQDGGRTWTEHRPAAGELNAFAVVGTAGGYVIAGEELDAAHEAHPRIWTSTDGATWTPTTVEGADGSGSIGHVTVSSRGDWLAAGTLNGRVVAWRSEDTRSWDVAHDFGAYDPGRIGVSLLSALPGGYLLITPDPTITMWTSADGVSWTPHEVDPPEVRGGEGTAALTSGIGRIGDRLVLAGAVTTETDPAGVTWHAWLGRITR